MTRHLPRLAVVLAAVALSSPAAVHAQGVRKAEPAADDAGPKVLPTLEERTAVFGDVDAAFKEGRKAKVADLLVEIVENPEHQVFHAEAYARLGGVLGELDLPYGALIAYERALNADAEAVSSVAKKAIALADAVGDTALLEPVFAANVGLDVDTDTRSRMAYLAAREAHSRGSYGTSLAILKLVSKDASDSAEAKSLEGVVLAQQGRHQDALTALLVAQGAAKAADKPQRLQDSISLNLGRAYFGAGNFPRAIELYASVSRASPYWPEAIFERAWAHFRLQDMNGTLALLHTLDAEWFSEWYFPEADLLRVYSLFLMCKFPDASKHIDLFQETYRPTEASLGQLAAQPRSELFDQMRSHVMDGASDLPSMVTRIYEGEDRFNDSLLAVRYAEDELARLSNVSANPFSQTVSGWVEGRRDALVEAEGGRIKGRIGRMQAELSGMLNDSEMSKLDLLQLESRLYEQAANLGDMERVRETVDRGVRVKRGYRHWPWQGEYWGDELGWYKFSARPDCPASLSGMGTDG